MQPVIPDWLRAYDIPLQKEPVNKGILNVVLILLTLALACYAVYWLIKGDQGSANLCMLGSLFVFVVVRGLLV